MRTRRMTDVLVTILSLQIVPVAWTWAQGAPAPSVRDEAGASAQVVTGVVLGLVVLVLLGIGVKTLDLKRRREAEAIQLQAQISDALQHEPLLFGVAITPTAHVPIWKGRATVEVAGLVPSPQAREVALRIVRAEAARVRSDVEIEDRLGLVPRRVA